MADTASFTKLVPGFDFLQTLVTQAGAALPHMGQWVAPTLNPEELEKRIDELRTVQFWLEQNARMLGATIQALEVQRMTLSTLKTMNVQMGDLHESLKIRLPEPEADEPDEAPEAEAQPVAATAAPAPTAASLQAVDPMRWWGALTKQFTELATSALRDTQAEALRAGAPGKAVRSSAKRTDAPAAGPGTADRKPKRATARRRKPAVKKAPAAGRD